MRVCVCVFVILVHELQGVTSQPFAARGTGLSWIPVPPKLFQDRGWVV